MKFKNKKVISAMICLFVTLILSINNMCYANINDNEIIDINETKKQAIETVSKNIENLKFVQMQILLQMLRKLVSLEQKVSDFAVQSICSSKRTESQHSVR